MQHVILTVDCIILAANFYFINSCCFVCHAKAISQHVVTSRLTPIKVGPSFFDFLSTARIIVKSSVFGTESILSFTLVRKTVLSHRISRTSFLEFSELLPVFTEISFSLYFYTDILYFLKCVPVSTN